MSEKIMGDAQSSDLLRAELAAHVLGAAENSHDVAGELLREWAFVKRSPDDVGCYSTFELRGGFEECQPTPELLEAMWGRPFDPRWDAEEVERISVYRHQLGVVVAWHWDGDGHLYFDAPIFDSAVDNTDCKCGYGWGGAARSPTLHLKANSSLQKDEAQ